MFITNKEQLLSELINNIIPTSENLYFLVGYFYFSGFNELYKELNDKKIKILVGMEVGKDIFNNLIEIDNKSEIKKNKSKNEIKKEFFNKFVEVFNETDYFDSSQKESSFKLFVNKIKNGSLEIRKTKEPNHAKLYLFEKKESHNEGGSYPGTIITGSSNLTFSGLKGREEINVVLRDKHYYEEAKSIFDNLWDDSIEVAGVDTLETFTHEIIEKIWLDYDKKIKKEPYLPYLMFIRVVYEYFYLDDKDIKLPSQISDGKFYDFKYQSDAIKQAIETINKHNGVIISDVVGLGKSIIASTVANNLMLPTIIIAPPHLKEQWNEYKRIFGFNAEIYSIGKLEQIYENYSELFLKREFLVIIDEAHKFRNEETSTYATLHKITQGHKVMLLTATPFSNKPEDIFSMIKLFQIPGKSTIQTVTTLSEEFRVLIAEYKKLKKDTKKSPNEISQTDKRIVEISQKIKNILSPLIIRRTRLDLIAIDSYRKDLEKQNISFPKVEAPEDSEYSLGILQEQYLKTLDDILPETIFEEDEDIQEENVEDLAIYRISNPKPKKRTKKGFNGTRYKPVAYLKDFESYKDIIKDEFVDPNFFKIAQTNIANFMRRMLVRRFESSIYAFKISLESMINTSETILEWYENGYIPIFKKGNIPDIADFLKDEDEINDLNDSLKFKKWSEKNEKDLVLLESKLIKVKFAKDLKSDIKLLENIQERWFPTNKIIVDPKLHKLKELLEKWLKKEPNRKIIIFTEFADTADYLGDKLKENFKAFKYTSSDASFSNKERIKLNFDASVNKSKQNNEFDILIATDAISEGYNLNRAGRIINYDIPYNPTRVIQRIGRINRVNKKVFDVLYIHNYFPSSIGEDETSTKKISTFKMAIIKAILGGDTQVLTKDEEVKPYLDKKFIAELSDREELSWDVEYRNILNEVKNTEILRKALKIPKRVKVSRNSENENGVIIFGKKGEEFVTKFHKEDKITVLDKENTLKLFKAEKKEQAIELSENFNEIYQKLKKDIFRIEDIKIKEGDTQFEKVINNLEYILENTNYQKDYIENLIKIFNELDGLPKYYQKIIRNIKIDKDIEIIINEIQKELPENYVNRVLKMAENIDKQDESLIFSEELRSL